MYKRTWEVIENNLSMQVRRLGVQGQEGQETAEAAIGNNNMDKWHLLRTLRCRCFLFTSKGPVLLSRGNGGSGLLGDSPNLPDSKWQMEDSLLGALWFQNWVLWRLLVLDRLPLLPTCKQSSCFQRCTQGSVLISDNNQTTLPMLSCHNRVSGSRGKQGYGSPGVNLGKWA